MVTQIIKQEEVHPAYLNINRWIRDGITEDAISLSVKNWRKIYYNQNYVIFNKIRNQNYDSVNIMSYISELNKW